MSEQLDPPLTPLPGLVPEAVAGRTFPNARRGLEPDSVRRFLEVVAGALRAMRQRDAELIRRLAEAERRVASPAFDQATLTAAVGAETARVLQAAHEAAHDLVAGAEERAQEILADATGLRERRRVEVEAETDALLDRARVQAAAAAEGVTEQCRAMVEEAKEVRRRILADLAQRRRQLHVQLEQLRAGKDALEAIFDTASSSVESLRVRLSGAEEEASAAAGEATTTLGAGDYDGLESVPDELVAEILLAESSEPSRHVDPDPAEDPASLSGDAGPPDSGEVLPVSSVTASSVDELFARIRASRANEVARAREVLAAGGEADDVPHLAPAGEADTGAARATVAASAPIVGDAPGGGTADAGTPDGGTGEGEAPTASAERGAHAPGIARHEPVAPEPQASSPEPVRAGAGAADDVAAREWRDALLTAPVEELERRLKRSLREDQNELLDGLRNLPRGADPTALLPGDASRGRLFAAAIDVLALIRRAGEVFAGPARERAESKLVLGDVNIADREGAEPVTRALAEEIVSTLLARIEAGFAQADGDEVALGEIAGAVFREWRGERIEKVAGDFAAQAFARGVIATATAQGVPVRWVVDDGDGGCPDCDDNALAEPLRAGDAFPTGQSVPPVHPGCRCMLVPVRA